MHCLFFFLSRGRDNEGERDWSGCCEFLKMVTKNVSLGWKLDSLFILLFIMVASLSCFFNSLFIAMVARLSPVSSSLARFLLYLYVLIFCHLFLIAWSLNNLILF